MVMLGGAYPCTARDQRSPDSLRRVLSRRTPIADSARVISWLVVAFRWPDLPLMRALRSAMPSAGMASAAGGRRPVPGPDRDRPCQVGDAVETRHQRLRHHLRRRFPAAETY